jgi:hypothetical protein
MLRKSYITRYSFTGSCVGVHGEKRRSYVGYPSQSMTYIE